MARLRILLSMVTLAAGLTAAIAAPPAAATLRAPAPPVPAGLPTAIEPLGGYVEQVACQPAARRGTLRLARLLARPYRDYGGATFSTGYACGTDGTRSEHYDGRAIDWMVDVHNTRQHAAAEAVIRWLLGTDAAGNRFAMARRLGVMYVIYDNRMWGAWDGRWEEYNNCSHLPAPAYDNSCHRTHMHISLTWDGAMGRTSFWTGRVPLPDYGTCRVADLNWAFRYTGRNPLPCPDLPLVLPAPHASAMKKALLSFSGAALHRGSGGPGVTAVQRGLGVPATALFDAATAQAVGAFQSRHRLTRTGRLNPSTWRALLAATK
jgi:peptidoglycan hydrolase-like protein with peptidoglycan-binding domain